MPLVYLNGDYLPLEVARVSVMDRGFLFGDGVYEVIPVYSRRPFRLGTHLDRLSASLAGIRLDNPLAAADWHRHLEEVIRRSETEDLGLYIQVTRGPAPRDQAFPAQARPTVLIMPLPLAPPSPELVASGVAAITAPDNRWQRCDLKATSLLANVLLRQLSVDAGCTETLLLRDGWLTEGTSSNVFAVLDGVVTTPPASHLTLPGVTSDVVLELAARLALPLVQRPIPEAELRQAEELWLTSSTKEVLAVTRLDGQPVGEGRPGPLFLRIHGAYQDYKRAVMRGQG